MPFLAPDGQDMRTTGIVIRAAGVKHTGKRCQQGLGQSHQFGMVRDNLGVCRESRRVVRVDDPSVWPGRWGGVNIPTERTHRKRIIPPLTRHCPNHIDSFQLVAGCCPHIQVQPLSSRQSGLGLILFQYLRGVFTIPLWSMHPCI